MTQNITDDKHHIILPVLILEYLSLFIGNLKLKI